MAAIDTSPAHYATARAAGRIGQVLANGFSAFAAWNDSRATRNELSKLTDRELDDIGLCRGDIDIVAGR